jgi:hypothetical protein
MLQQPLPHPSFPVRAQDYVQLVVRTGAHIEHRWNELSVQSMMWQVFVPPDKFHAFDPRTEVGSMRSVCTVPSVSSTAHRSNSNASAP